VIKNSQGILMFTEESAIKSDPYFTALALPIVGEQGRVL
jgi:hypothetical protein